MTTPTPSRRCPQPGCTEKADVASEAETAAGAWIWRCLGGHHGPRILFPVTDA